MTLNFLGLRTLIDDRLMSRCLGQHRKALARQKARSVQRCWWEIFNANRLQARYRMFLRFVVCVASAGVFADTPSRLLWESGNAGDHGVWRISRKFRDNHRVKTLVNSSAPGMNTQYASFCYGGERAGASTSPFSALAPRAKPRGVHRHTFSSGGGQ